MSTAIYATGRRKKSIARVYLKAGSGKLNVNDLECLDYFKRATLKMQVEQPLDVTNTLGQVDITVHVTGGGLTGQAGAVKHGISRALLKFNDDNRKVLRDAGFLTRDSRMVERKKYGQAKARKRYQFSKR
ncbi:MAG: 30S ribosomal protein S9 [Calditrichaeota bacterium]|nr:30S ribosomal protein S9 [Calditrichota bacterium]